MGFVIGIIAVIVGLLIVHKLISSSILKVDQESPYHKMRNNFLNLDYETAGINKATSKNCVWGVLMEVGFCMDDHSKQSTVSVVSMIDGSASMYIETGGGIIGGGFHQNIHDAAVAIVNVADDFVNVCTTANNFPLPSPGVVNFYILTKKGVLCATADEDELTQKNHRLSPLFYAGHDVLTQLRKIEEDER